MCITEKSAKIENFSRVRDKQLLKKGIARQREKIGTFCALGTLSPFVPTNPELGSNLSQPGRRLWGHNRIGFFKNPFDECVSKKNANFNFSDCTG